MTQTQKFAELLASAERDHAAGTPVTDANGDPVLVFPGTEITPVYRVFMSGRVLAQCGHYTAASEARAGFKSCERCAR